MAARHGQFDCVVILAQAGSLLDVRDRNGSTPLFLAVSRGLTSVVEELVRRNANAAIAQRARLLLPGEEEPGLGMPTCLGLAAGRGQLGLVRALLLGRRATALTEGRDASAIHYAAQGIQGEHVLLDKNGIVTALAEAGVDPNATLKSGRETALHVACGKRTSPATIRAILNAGGNVHATDYKRDTPLHLACRERFRCAVKLLLFYGADES